MKIPSREECLKLLKKYNYDPPTHVVAVSNVAVFLANKLKEKGENVNIPLVEAASLLHDIDKNELKRLNLGITKHGEHGHDILVKEGYPEVAAVIKKHTLWTISDNERKPKTWEEKLVFYADKITDSEVMTLDERFEKWMKKYSSDKELIIKSRPFTETIEKEIFDKIGKKYKNIKKFL